MPLFQKGSRFSSGSDEGRWQVIRKLGEGQFAEVYEVKDTCVRDRDARFAVKIEKRRDVKSVKQEFKILHKLQELSLSSVCGSSVTGTFEDRFFIVMELLGLNLAELRREAGGWLPPAVVRCIGLSTLASLQGIHDAGFLHRDVKPANFALFPPNSNVLQGTFKIIDFGLARRFTDDSGAAMPQRSDTAFRGSTTYASVHAHQELDLGRRDDLWSWLYCLVELLDGTLPWRADAAAAANAGRDGESGPSANGRELRERVRELKQHCMAQPSLLTRTIPVPDAIANISNHLCQLDFGDTPDYHYIRSCLLQMGEAQPQLGQAAAGAGQAAGHPSDYQQHQQQHQHQQHQQYYGAPAVGPDGMPMDHQQQQQQAIMWGQGGWVAHDHQPQGREGSKPEARQQAAPIRDTPLSPVRDTPLSPPPDDGGAWRGASPALATAHATAPQQLYGGPAVHRPHPDAAQYPDWQPPSAWPQQQQQQQQVPWQQQQQREGVPAAVADAWVATGRQVQGGVPPGYSASEQVQEERAAQSMGEAAAAVRQGLLSPEAQQLQRRLGALHPVEAVAVVAAVVQEAAEAADPAVGNILAQALYDLSLFTRHTARHADAQYVKYMSGNQQAGPEQYSQQQAGRTAAGPSPAGQYMMAGQSPAVPHLMAGQSPAMQY